MSSDPVPLPVVASSSPTEPTPSLDLLLPLIGDKTRWRILRELAAGEPLMVIEIAGRIGASPSLVSKHLGRLRRAGLVVVGRAGLYRIPEPYLVNAAERIVDFGRVVLRLA